MKFQLLSSLLLLPLFLLGCSDGSIPPVPNVAPTTECNAINSPIIAGSEVQINCLVSDDSKVNTELQLSWNVEKSPEGFTTTELPATAAFSLIPTVAGDYTLKLTADDGELSTTAEVSFTTIINDPPIISCDSIEDPIARDEAVTVSCTVEDDGVPSDSIDLTWAMLEHPDGVEETDLGEQASTTFTPTVEGEYLLKFTADDSNASSSSEITLTVINTNTAPVITCPDTTLRTAVDDPITVSCDFTDDGKRPAAPPEIAWSTLLVPTGAEDQEYPADTSIQFNSNVPGNYELEFSVNDGELTTTEIISVWVTPDAEIKILPLGDSITEGLSVLDDMTGNIVSLQSYRYRLWQKLLDAGSNFDFVGNNNTTLFGDNPPPEFPDYLDQTFDPDHEGHSGITADGLLSVLPALQIQYDADLVLLHIGSNDMLRGVINELPTESVGSTIVEIGEIIDTLRSENPVVTILLATPIPSIHDTKLPELQAKIRTLATATSTAQSKVVLVDQAVDFEATVGIDTVEGIHPNSAGEEKIAQKWFEAIDAL